MPLPFSWNWPRFYRRQTMLITGSAILDAMNRSPLEFHLTGSRFFGTATTNSDWDFFVQDGPGVQDKLLWLGFMHLTEHSYKDSNTLEVWRYTTLVHVQVVKDATLKAKIQKIFKSRNILRPSRKCWDLAYELTAIYGIAER